MKKFDFLFCSRLVDITEMMMVTDVFGAAEEVKVYQIVNDLFEGDS
jgi:hypothetical protein